MFLFAFNFVAVQRIILGYLVRLDVKHWQLCLFV